MLYGIKKLILIFKFHIFINELCIYNFACIRKTVYLPCV